MEKIFRVLRFFRITDEQNNLSLTNIAVMVAIGKICVTKATGLEDVGLLLVPLLNYSHKRFTNKEK